MKTYATEDKRKDKLFKAWIDHLYATYANFGKEEEFDDIYEGLVKIQNMTASSMNIELEDGRKIKGLPITKDIFDNLLKDDTLYMTIGRKKSQWLPLEVTSIASFVNKKNGMFHFSVNPLMVQAHNAKIFEAMASSRKNASQTLH